MSKQGKGKVKQKRRKVKQLPQLDVGPLAEAFILHDVRKAFDTMFGTTEPEVKQMQSKIWQ
jgi:hypothetical protein